MTDQSNPDPLADALNTDPLEKKELVIKASTQGVNITSTTDGKPDVDPSDQDFEEVRKNLKNVIDASQTAMDGILLIAQEGEEPRAYEVVADLVRTTLEANAKLMELHKTIKTIKNTGGAKSEGKTNVTNNSIYVGSTNELLQMLKGKKPATNLNVIDADSSDRST